MKIKIIFVILFLSGAVIGAGITAKIVSKSKDREFDRTEKVYTKTIDRYATAYETLASQARYMISQSLTIKKNKKGQIIYVPTSTMEIDKMIKSIDEKIKNPDGSIIEEQDSTEVTSGKAGILSWFKRLFKRD